MTRIVMSIPDFKCNTYIVFPNERMDSFQTKEWIHLFIRRNAFNKKDIPWWIWYGKNITEMAGYLALWRRGPSGGGTPWKSYTPLKGLKFELEMAIHVSSWKINRLPRLSKNSSLKLTHLQRTSPYLSRKLLTMKTSQMSLIFHYLKWPLIKF
jgi:hypothetical protein